MKTPRAHANQGFTLVEVLVSIAIIGVLIAILLPALGAVRVRGHELESVSNLKQIGVTTRLYTGEYGFYYFGRTGWIRPDTENHASVTFPIWFLEHNWPLLVHRVAPWDEHHPVWVSPRADTQPWIDLLNGTTVMTSLMPTSYQYSNAFVARPAVWDPDAAAPVDERAIGPIRPAQVASPSAKVLMYDAERAYLTREPTERDPRPVLLADGSARRVLDTDAAQPVQNRLTDWSPREYHDTPRGIEGRDF